MSAKNEDYEQSVSTLSGLLNGHVMSRLIHAVSGAGIPDLLGEGVMECGQLAQKAGVHPGSLYRIMRALCAVGIFTEVKKGFFGLGKTGELLRTDITGSQHALAVLMWEPFWRQGWDNLPYSLKTGKVAFEHVHGLRLFGYLGRNPEAAELFGRAMGSLTAQEINSILDAYDFSGIEKAVDIGGGQGMLLAAILEKYRSMKGILFELPAVIEAARGLLDKDISNRIELVAGDFFDPFPFNGDAFILKSVIHDWDDEHAGAILRNCRESINENGRLVLIERIMPFSNEPSRASIMDIVMLVNLGGRERTLAEYEGLLNSSGFRLGRVVDTNSAMSIIEAIPV